MVATTQIIPPPPVREHPSFTFLRNFRPDEPWVLSTFKPRPVTATCRSNEEVLRFLAEHQGQDTYFAINPLRGDVSKKAAKADVLECAWFWADCDPRAGENPEEERRRIEGLRPRVLPTIIIDSGRGRWFFWKLSSPIPADAEAERYNIALEIELGADRCHNVDRVARLPGTVNSKTGRLAAVVEWHPERVYDVLEFTKAPMVQEPGGGKIIAFPGNAPRVNGMDDPRLEKSPDWAKVVIAQGLDPENPKKHPSRSEWQFAASCELVRSGVDDETHLAILLDPDLGISASILDKKSSAESYARRQIARAHVEVGAAAEFVRDDDGAIYKHLYCNSQVAVRALGARPRYDEFADRMLVEGLDGFGPAIADADMNRLHQRVQEEFRFTPEMELFRRAITNLAHENRFHPVRDYLGGLPPWDGIRRLDSWLTNYLGAEEKPYSSAVGRVVLIAAVRRVRQPGCKFDEMLILEGPQGRGKSSALRILTGRPEWFHDKVPLHDTTQRIFESIHGKWILEVSELACFGQAQVENLKNVVAQQVDRTRLPYDRIPRDFPRQCIFCGTTNDRSYLRDPTGNRRYWPVQVGDIRLADLERDRDQLWSEAAAAEATGETIRLSSELWAAAGSEQEERMRIDPWEEVLEEKLEGKTGRIRTGEFAKLLFVSLERLDAHRLGGILRRLGWERSKQRFGERVLKCWVKGTDEERRQVLEVQCGNVVAEEAVDGGPY